MMITVITRTLNEEHRINEFCLAYTDADKIIVADGGSTDDTVKLAQRFHNVEVIHFTERRELGDGYWRNPDSRHVNFAIEHANKYSPDWIILDDVDCRPNCFLKQYLKFLKTSTLFPDVQGKNFISVTRIYFYGLDKHLPGLAQPSEAGTWEASLWAWRGNIDLWTVDDNFPHYSLRVGDKKIPYPGWDDEQLKLMPPHCLLHYTWDKEERVESKLKHHREGLGIGMNHPLNMGSPLADLEIWMKE